MGNDRYASNVTRRELLSASLLSALGIGAAGRATAQEARPFTGGDVFQRLLDRSNAEGWETLPMGERVGRVGMALMDTPYVAFTLELWTDREACVVNLKGLDCVTFFESSLGFARMLERGSRTPGDLMREVTRTRYRGGTLGDYTTRLHYTCDWMHDNARKGTVQLLTPELPGAERFTERVYFMSQNPDKYRQLKANPSLVPKIRAAETAINARETFFIPVAKVAAIEERLQTGDILGITAGQKGIDCAHTGICVRDADGTLRFAHASLSQKKVLLDKRLSEYLKGWATGIMVARPI